MSGALETVAIEIRRTRVVADGFGLVRADMSFWTRNAFRSLRSWLVAVSSCALLRKAIHTFMTHLTLMLVLAGRASFTVEARVAESFIGSEAIFVTVSARVAGQTIRLS